MTPPPTLRNTNSLSLRSLTNSDSNDFSSSILVGTVLSLVFAVLAFVLIALTFCRHRRRKRIAASQRHLTQPAVRAAEMANYAREQEERIRGVNARVHGGSVGSVSSGGFGAGTGKIMASVGVREERRPPLVGVDGSTPPPSYSAERSPPGLDRVVVR